MGTSVKAPAKYRTIFISDFHLGTKDCQAQHILDFLRVHDAETIYIVGDAVDFWRLKLRTYWPQTHNDVVQKLLRKVRAGTRLIYIPGNHDEALRDYCGSHFGGVEVMLEDVHTTADGKRLLVVHGDAFDGVIHTAEWLRVWSCRSYSFALWSNTMANRVRRAFGYGQWSLAHYLKTNVSRAVTFIDQYERRVAEEAAKRGLDGVVCGHIHHAADKTIAGLSYRNCGDWVESCTALAETHDGSFELIRWLDQAAAKPEAVENPRPTRSQSPDLASAA